MRAYVVVIVILVVGTAAFAGYFEVTHHRSVEREARALTGGSPRRGREKIREYGCIACHDVPGFAGTRAYVGPPLDGFALRMYVGGTAENQPANLMQFLIEPRKVVAQGAMPNLHVTEADARDLAAYLYTLR